MVSDSNMIKHHSSLLKTTTGVVLLVLTIRSFNTCGDGNAVVGNVDFMPWCTDEDCTGTSADLPVSNISKSPVAYYCTIQDAIDDAGTGGEIIMVGDGIFYENIVINKDNLTVKNSVLRL